MKLEIYIDISERTAELLGKMLSSTPIVNNVTNNPPTPEEEVTNYEKYADLQSLTSAIANSMVVKTIRSAPVWDLVPGTNQMEVHVRNKNGNTVDIPEDTWVLVVKSRLMYDGDRHYAKIIGTYKDQAWKGYYLNYDDFRDG